MKKTKWQKKNVQVLASFLDRVALGMEGLERDSTAFKPLP
jgi:hypothetical protein